MLEVREGEKTVAASSGNIMRATIIGLVVAVTALVVAVFVFQPGGMGGDAGAEGSSGETATTAEGRMETPERAERAGGGPLIGRAPRPSVETPKNGPGPGSVSGNDAPGAAPSIARAGEFTSRHGTAAPGSLQRGAAGDGTRQQRPGGDAQASGIRFSGGAGSVDADGEIAAPDPSEETTAIPANVTFDNVREHEGIAYRINPHERLTGRAVAQQADGSLVEGNFSDGLRHGSFTVYDADGRVQAREFYAHGDRNGTLSTFYPDGSPHFEARIVDGQQAGATVYRMDGSVQTQWETDASGRRIYSIGGEGPGGGN